MKRFKTIWTICFTWALVSFSIYALMDTFVISRVVAVVDEKPPMTASIAAKGDAKFASDVSEHGEKPTDSAGNAQTQDASITDTTYSDDHITITLSTLEKNDTTVHVADVVVDDPAYLKTAFADHAYGKNVTAKTSETADAVNAILAINGDYYGARESGYVIKEGQVYRDEPVAGQEDLVIYEDGSFGVINESEVSAVDLVAEGVVNLLSFGPALVKDGAVAVSLNAEVAKSMTSNPRTAIGIISEGHYVFVVSDGRTDESEGLSLYELADIMCDLGCETAYNLDGGGSSTMVFNGAIVNVPTGGGHGSRSGERSVSDIVYIGY